MSGFCLEKGMGYGVSGSMSYGLKSPAYQLGGSKNVWVIREYGLSGLWVMRESTVITYSWELQIFHFSISTAFHNMVQHLRKK